MMSREYERLEESHRKILDRHLSECPVKLGKLAGDLGVSIKVSHMNVGLSGQITRESNGYKIRVNRYEARERQRYTIAHELAHFLLHRVIIDSLPDGITDNVLYRSGRSEHVEYEANRLPADIIMPMPLVEKAVREEFSRIVSDAAAECLAARFQVPKAAMKIRLSPLSLGDARCREERP